MQPAMAKQLKALQKENSRLKKVVADQVLDIEILREAAGPPFGNPTAALIRWKAAEQGYAPP